MKKKSLKNQPKKKISSKKPKITSKKKTKEKSSPKPPKKKPVKKQVKKVVYKTEIKLETKELIMATSSLIVPLCIPSPCISIEMNTPKAEKSTMYFTNATEEAIVEYNEAKTQGQRDRIYSERIKYPFEKIAENIFNTFKFSYHEVSPLNMQREAVSHMVANMSKYHPARGKAFGYFSIVAKNWFILENNTNYKRFKKHVEIIDEPKTIGEFVIEPEHEKQDRTNREFIQLMVDYLDENITSLFSKEKDLNIARAVIEIFRNSDRIDIFNKKALYLYIREIANCQTQHITKVINKMISLYVHLRKEYMKNGFLRKERIPL